MKRLHLQLFWYERYQALLEMEDLPILTDSQLSELNVWMKKRRKILNYEVYQQPWIKVNEDGFSSIMELHPGGKLVEKDLFSDRVNNGIWKVVDGFLFIKVINNEFIVEYQIVGNNTNNLHAGIEYINGHICTYSKFAKLDRH